VNASLVLDIAGLVRSTPLMTPHPTLRTRKSATVGRVPAVAALPEWNECVRSGQGRVGSAAYEALVDGGAVRRGRGTPMVAGPWQRRHRSMMPAMAVAPSSVRRQVIA
jgi:hypothetical protein